MPNPRIVLILALSVFLLSCSPGAPAAPAPTSAPTSAASATFAAPMLTVPAAQPTRGPTSAAASNFSATDPQLAPPGIKGDAANGTKLFSQKKIECDGCHDVTHNYPGGDLAPNLANITITAATIIKSPDYKGKAKTVAEYVRESILAPNIYIVPNDDYREKDGTSAMNQDFAKTLTPQQVEDLVAYVLSLKPE